MSPPPGVMARNQNGGRCCHRPPLSRMSLSLGSTHLWRRFRPEPFGSGRFLGFPCTFQCSGSLTGHPSKSCNFAGFPIELLDALLLRSALRGSMARKPGAAGQSGESGFGLRLALLLQFTRIVASSCAPSREFAPLSASISDREGFVAEGLSSPRKSIMTPRSESHQAKSDGSEISIL